MKSDLYKKILRLSIVEILLQLGFEKCSEESLNIFTEILEYYIEKITDIIYKFREHSTTYDIDTLNEIAAWIVNDETGVAKMNKDISDLKIDVSGLKEQVQTATTGLLDRTTSLENLVGEKTVSAQINEAVFINNKAIYALSSDLSNSNQRIEKLESHVDTWNAAVANVQSDWNESDTTSDAYILNKPDLTNIIETTSQFDYTVGNITNQLTIAQLVAKVAELEATIQTLTAST